MTWSDSQKFLRRKIFSFLPECIENHTVKLDPFRYDFENRAHLWNTQSVWFSIHSGRKEKIFLRKNFWESLQIVPNNKIKVTCHEGKFFPSFPKSRKSQGWITYRYKERLFNPWDFLPFGKEGKNFPSWQVTLILLFGTIWSDSQKFLRRKIFFFLPECIENHTDWALGGPFGFLGVSTPIFYNF